MLALELRLRESMRRFRTDQLGAGEGGVELDEDLAFVDRGVLGGRDRDDPTGDLGGDPGGAERLEAARELNDLGGRNDAGDRGLDLEGRCELARALALGGGEPRFAFSGLGRAIRRVEAPRGEQADQGCREEDQHRGGSFGGFGHRLTGSRVRGVLPTRGSSRAQRRNGALM